jgi:hypothetical protein
MPNVYLATTKFNNQTYLENKHYKINNAIKGCIYGTNMQINEKYKQPSYLFVIEMNNETNKIEGIGYISNIPETKKHNIYLNDNFNRYSYKGNYHLNRTEIPEHLVAIFDTILFKGKSNLKRISGISVITQKLFSHWTEYNHDHILYELKTLFLNHIKS